jgi:LuxR family maltose regulon positive regulatory protein
VAGLAPQPITRPLPAPELRAGLVYRAGVVNRLRVERAPVVFLTAPPGYGKTTVLAQWARRDAREFRWLRFERGDDDPGVFPPLLAEVLAPEGSGRTASARLRSSLRARTEPLVIVLDNVEQLRSPESLDLLASLISHLGPATQLVAAGRQAPTRLLARVRAEGRLSELSAADLRLSDREAQSLLQSAGIELALDEAKEVNRRAEGWAAGVYLGALALATRRGDVPRRPHELHGAHHFVSGYFESEVLSRLAPQTLRFALRAAVLDRMSGPVCDAVAGAPGSANRLKELVSAGAFLVPLDRERTTFRFHRYLRDTLLWRLKDEQPDEFIACSRRAAAWYEQAGNVPAALHHLREAGDHAEAVRLLGLLGPEVFCRGLLAGIEPSLNDLRGERLLLRHQAAAVTGALAHALLGNVGEVDRWTLAAEEARPEQGLPDGSKTSEGWSLLLRAALCRDGLARMAEDAEAAAVLLSRHSAMNACALLLAGVAQLLLGDAGAAELSFGAAAARGAAEDAPMIESLAHAELSLLAQSDDRWSEAEEHARKARELADLLDGGDHAAAALAGVASARSALRNSNWARAGSELERVHPLLSRLGEALPWLAVQVRVELARAHLALNDAATAAELSTEVAGILLARPHLGTLRDEAARLQRDVDELRDHPAGRAATLTAAELRLLPLLTTHLSFRQIADHLYVSRNTVKTQAISVYRKLGVASRTEAIERAIEIGLLRPEGAADHPKRAMSGSAGAGTVVERAWRI